MISSEHLRISHFNISHGYLNTGCFCPQVEAVVQAKLRKFKCIVPFWENCRLQRACYYSHSWGKYTLLSPVKKLTVLHTTSALSSFPVWVYWLCWPIVSGFPPQFHSLPLKSAEAVSFWHFWVWIWAVWGLFLPSGSHFWPIWPLFSINLAFLVLLFIYWSWWFLKCLVIRELLFHGCNSWALFMNPALLPPTLPLWFLQVGIQVPGFSVHHGEAQPFSPGMVQMCPAGLRLGLVFLRCLQRLCCCAVIQALSCLWFLSGISFPNCIKILLILSCLHSCLWFSSLCFVLVLCLFLAPDLN